MGTGTTRGTENAARAVSGRELLVDAAHGLFIARGFADVSMQEIAEAAGMTKGAPYYHFRSKEDLFTEVVIREIGRLQVGLEAALATEAPLHRKLEVALTYMLGTVSADFGRIVGDLERYVGADRKHAILETCQPSVLFVAAVRPAFEAAAAAGTFRRVPPDVAAELFVATTMGQVELALMETLHAPDGRSPTVDRATHAGVIVDAFLHGI